MLQIILKAQFRPIALCGQKDYGENLNEIAYWKSELKINELFSNSLYAKVSMQTENESVDKVNHINPFGRNRPLHEWLAWLPPQILASAHGRESD